MVDIHTYHNLLLWLFFAPAALTNSVRSFWREKGKDGQPLSPGGADGGALRYRAKRKEVPTTNPECVWHDRKKKTV